MTIAPPMDRRSDASSDLAREQAGRVVHGVYRLVKGRLLHDDANQAITQLVDALAQAVGDYAAASKGSTVAVLFASNNVFVDRQMLRASRETYQLALELGEMLATFGITELSLSHPLDRAEAHDMASAIALAQRDRSLARKERLEGWQTIKARRVVAFSGGTQLTPVQRAARTYAASVLIVQSFYRQLREGASELPHGIKRVAQRLVTAAEDDSRLLLVIAASPSTAADRAATAVSTAIIALAMARQLTSDRTALLGLASAAVLYDVGRPRMVRTTMSGVERSLTDAEQEKLPASTVAALTALGKLHPGSLARAVIAYEALGLRVGAGKVYGGRRPPSVLARVLHTARTFVEARAGQGALEAGASMDDAVQALFGQARDATERTYAKLLLGALGLFPAGTLVELTTGELAVVTATPRQPIDFARPPVRVLYDRDANLLEAPIDLDLAMPPRPGEPARLIQRAVDADEQQMRQMRAYVAGLSTAAARPAAKPAAPARAIAPPPEPPAPPPVRPPTGPVRAAGTIPPRARTGAPPVADAASLRPRRDPRADDTDPGSMPPPASAAPATPRSGAGPSQLPDPDLAARPAEVKAPSMARAEPHATAASTRAMSWDQYGQLVDETQLPLDAVTRTMPPPPDATDALLAAYLDEAPSRGGGNHGLRGWGNEPSSQRDSSRAAWGGPESSGGPTSSSRDSSRLDPPSSGGPRSSSQASWSAIPSSRRPDPPSSEPPRSRSLSGRSRTCTQDWTTAPRGPASIRGGSPIRRSPVPPPPPPEEPPSTGRKPKADRQGWGADKK